MAIDINISTTFLGDTDTPDTYVNQGSKKLVVKEDETGVEFIEDSGGTDTNVMNTDLTAAADRSQNMNSNSMSFTNGKQFKWLNNVAPTIGEGSFDLEAYGTTSSDIIFRLKNGSSAVKMKVLGDGSTEWLTGFHSFGDSINAGAKLQGVTNSGGVVALRGYHYGTGGRAGDFQADGANAMAVKANAIGFGASAVKAQGYYALDLDGRVLTVNFTIGNSGTTTGQWYADSAANILANGDYVIGMKS